jgi:predicted glycoside hydrolase/deacetylase ChbG (UPF0249 family)
MYAKIDEVEEELRAQIDRCRNAGVRFSHLDQHMYDLAIRYSIAMPAPGDLDPKDAELVKAYRDGLAALQSLGMPVDTDNY